MKIKQLKEKTIKGFIDFLPKIGINDIEGLLNALNDKLSKSKGGEVNKPIVVTNSNSDYSTTINPNGTIYICYKYNNNNILNIEPYGYSGGVGIDITGKPLRLNDIESINAYKDTTFIGFKVTESAYVYANKFIKNNATNKDVLLGDGSTTSNLIRQITTNISDTHYILNVVDIGNNVETIALPGATNTLAGLMTAYDKAKLDDIPNIYAIKSKTISNIAVNNLNNKRGLYILVDYADRTNPGTTVNIPNATTTSDGCMSYEDKNKLDNIENTYLPLSGGTLTDSLYVSHISSASREGFLISNSTGIQHLDPDKALTPEVWSTDGNSIPLNKKNGIPTLNADGKIDEDKIDNLRGYISSQNGNIYSRYDTNNGNIILNVTGNYDEEGSGGRIMLKRTEDNKGKLSIVIDGAEGSVNAENFKAIANPNKNEVWCTDGTRLDILNLLSNAAIYVAGSFALAEGGINSTTVIDSPNEIIFDRTVLGGRFLARKGIVCYTHWKADISKNIAPPSRYGIETDDGVFPFNNQMYKFTINNYTYIATCSNGTCTMKELTLQ